MEIITKIPDTLIRYNEKDNSSTLERRMRLYLYIYLAASFSKRRYLMTTIEHILRKSGMESIAKQLKHTSRYKVLRQLLWELEDNDFISGDKPLEDYRINEPIIIKYDLDDLIVIDRTFNGTYTLDKNFTLFTTKEWNLLVENNNAKTKLNDLQVYMTVKSWVRLRRPDESPTLHPEVCVLTLKAICDSTGLSINTVRDSLHRLENKDELNLLATIKPHNKWRGQDEEIDSYFNTHTLYAVKIGNYEAELANGDKAYSRYVYKTAGKRSESA